MLHIRFSVLLLIVILSGCANFNSIGRSSSLGGISNTQNTAIHLDAQQRVLLSKENMAKVCAEPSPDAMAAYAAALGLGVQIPKFGGGSLAQGGGSSIADIGLRTQSITLMRDVLYRLCEASMNGMVTEYHVPPLLARGMDLTAVVLATEQLTGAVVATQAALTSKSNASASSDGSRILQAKQEALDEAKRNTQKTQGELDSAKSNLTDKKIEVGTKRTVYEEASKADQSKEENVKAVNQAKKDLEQVKKEEEELQKVVDSKEKALVDAKDFEAAVAASRDAVITQMKTNATIETSGESKFDDKNARNSEVRNIEQIAVAVQEMVMHVLDKEYATEGCLSYIGNASDGGGANKEAITKDSMADKCVQGLKDVSSSKHSLALEKLKIQPELLRLQIDKLKEENEKKRLEIKKMELEAEKQGKNKEKPKAETSAKVN